MVKILSQKTSLFSENPMTNETELDLLRRYFYSSRELIGAIMAGGLPEFSNDEQERLFWEPVVRLNDQVEGIKTE